MAPRPITSATCWRGFVQLLAGILCGVSIANLDSHEQKSPPLSLTRSITKQTDGGRQAGKFYCRIKTLQVLTPLALFWPPSAMTTRFSITCISTQKSFAIRKRYAAAWCSILPYLAHYLFILRKESWAKISPTPLVLARALIFIPLALTAVHFMPKGNPVSRLIACH